MLILVAVTVNVAVNSGLFGNAQSATRAIGDGTFNIVVNGVTYSSLEEYLATQIPELDRNNIQVGDYIAYTPDTVATPYSLTSAVSGYGSADSPQSISQETTLQWRVMSINEDGSVDLVSATPTRTDLYFQGALGYNNGVLVLNDLCAELYSNASLGVTARSIDIVDIENKMNATGIAERDAYTNDNKQYGQTQTYTDSNSYAPDIFGKTGTTAEEESKDYYASPTTATSEKKGSIEVIQTYYNFGTTTPTTYFDDATFHELIFSTGSTFWIASRYYNCYSTYEGFGLRRVRYANLGGSNLLYSDNRENNNHFCVRPVVSLGSNIKISTEGGTAESPRVISL